MPPENEKDVKPEADVETKPETAPEAKPETSTTTAPPAKTEAQIRDEIRAEVKAEAEAKAQREKLEAEGKFKELLDVEREKNRVLTAQIAEMNLKSLRETVGRKHGLSDLQSARLIGTTEKEIDEDAQKVKKDLEILADKGGGLPPGTPPGERGGGTRRGTEEQRNTLASSGNYSL